MFHNLPSRKPHPNLSDAKESNSFHLISNFLTPSPSKILNQTLISIVLHQKANSANFSMKPSILQGPLLTLTTSLLKAVKAMKKVDFSLRLMSYSVIRFRMFRLFWKWLRPQEPSPTSIFVKYRS